MREESTLNRIVLRAVRRIVSDANLQTDRFAEPPEVVFEDVLVCRIAATAITGQKNRSCLWITLLANSIPVPLETIAGELARVVR